jgi:hypothetical protein
MSIPLSFVGFQGIEGDVWSDAVCIDPGVNELFPSIALWTRHRIQQAWTERWRRTIMHHDRKSDISATWVWLAEARRRLNRLAYQV